MIINGLTAIVLLIAISTNIQAQKLDFNLLDNLPEGIYSTYMTYQAAVPTHNMALDKKYINKRAKKEKWMGACFFTYKVNDQRIAAPFLIKKEEEVYLSTAFVRSKQDDRDNVKLDLGPDQSYTKVIEKGRFW